MRRRARLPGDRLGLHRCLSAIAMPALLRPGPAAPSAPPTCPSRGRQRVALPSHRRGAAGAARKRSGNAPGAGTEPGMHRERRGNGAGAEREPGLARRPPRRGWREAAEKVSCLTLQEAHIFPGLPFAFAAVKLFLITFQCLDPRQDPQLG
ncbi:uncharacterized protein LOC102073346 isoform X2 [Zonotrichia albicollis]|uniref:uncharacterized protein LOC102073346 isoform X2 n=1 Tax=Zonotrichia albicollis TaxID=44394 RepID=UPI003D80C5FB